MSRLRGVKSARARARARPDILETKAGAAIQDTIEAVHQTGKANISTMVTRRTGILERNYKLKFSKKQLLGEVGFVSRRAMMTAYYARFVNDGTRHAQARPFHDLAVAQHEPGYRGRMRSALKLTLKGD